MNTKPDRRYLRNFRHGYRTRPARPEYNSWRNMKARCYQLTNSRYNTHGARGIKVCERWLNSFENFLEDMGTKPGKKYSLDRIDNNGNYNPDNCRWATSSQQARNRSNNRTLTHDGKTLTLAEWADLTGLTIKLISARLIRGKSASEALGPKQKPGMKRKN